MTDASCVTRWAMLSDCQEINPRDSGFREKWRAILEPVPWWTSCVSGFVLLAAEGSCTNAPRAQWVPYFLLSPLIYKTSKQGFITATYSMDQEVLFLCNKPNTVHFRLHIKNMHKSQGVPFISTENNHTKNSSYHLLSFFSVPTIVMYLWIHYHQLLQSI